MRQRQEKPHPTAKMEIMKKSTCAELDRFITSINPHFALGHSSPNRLDCGGLIILWLRNLGYECGWESSLTREPLTMQDMYNFLVLSGAEEMTRKPKVPRIAFWEASPGHGHLGLYQPSRNCVYHMTPWGLRDEILENCSYWIYRGE